MMTLGEFQLTERVAQGGMAEVWRGVHEPSDAPVAVKLPASSGGRVDPRLARALHHEATAMASLRSGRVVQVHDVGVVSAVEARGSGGRLQEGAPWMAMEWIGGGTVEARVRSWADLQGALLDVTRALAHAHAHGLVHRDVKPANVLVESVSPLRVKLADFGIAFARRAYLEASGDGPPLALTPMFAAPEQVGPHAASQGPWTDLYQLGCLAYALACGEPPFASATDPKGAARAHLRAPRPALRPQFAVPDGLEGWVHQLMARRPAERFGCAGDAAQALAGLDPESARRRRGPGSVAPTPRIVGPTLATLRSPRLIGRDRERAELDRLAEGVAASSATRIALVRGRAPRPLGSKPPAAPARGVVGYQRHHFAHLFWELVGEAPASHLRRLRLSGPRSSWWPITARSRRSRPEPATPRARPSPGRFASSSTTRPRSFGAGSGPATCLRARCPRCTRCRGRRPQGWIGRPGSSSSAPCSGGPWWCRRSSCRTC